MVKAWLSRKLTRRPELGRRQTLHGTRARSEGLGLPAKRKDRYRQTLKRRTTPRSGLCHSPALSPRSTRFPGRREAARARDVHAKCTARIGTDGALGSACDSSLRDPKLRQIRSGRLRKAWYENETKRNEWKLAHSAPIDASTKRAGIENCRRTVMSWF
jgi:hypothetical protein